MEIIDGTTIDLPIRKNIRLTNYNYASNGRYFVTICTHNRQCILGNIVGDNLCVVPSNAHSLTEKWLKELEIKYKNITIDKYIIMPNHVHFILFINTTGEHIGSPLHTMIQWYKTQTTNAYITAVKENQLAPFHKHIWQRRYYEHIIRNEKEYQEIWQYIDTNPIKWKEDCYYSR